MYRSASHTSTAGERVAAALYAARNRSLGRAHVRLQKNRGLSTFQLRSPVSGCRVAPRKPAAHASFIWPQSCLDSYTFLVMIMMLNILIAVVSDSYDFAVIRSQEPLT